MPWPRPAAPAVLAPRISRTEGIWRRTWAGTTRWVIYKYVSPPFDNPLPAPLSFNPGRRTNPTSQVLPLPQTIQCQRQRLARGSNYHPNPVSPPSQEDGAVAQPPTPACAGLVFGRLHVVGPAAVRP